MSSSSKRRVDGAVFLRFVLLMHSSFLSLSPLAGIAELRVFMRPPPSIDRDYRHPGLTKIRRTIV